MPKITIQLTRAEAERYGLLRCECGWPRNNHFYVGKRLCAHNEDCKGYKEIPKVGKFVNQKPATRLARLLMRLVEGDDVGAEANRLVKKHFPKMYKEFE